jgi:hypothetical protein
MATQLQIGPPDRWVGFEEGAAFRVGRGDHAAAVFSPAQHMPDQAGQAAQADPHHVGIPGCPGQDEIEVVLQVLADAGQFMDDRNAVRCKFDGRADSGQQQELRRAEGAAADDDLTLRFRNRLASTHAIAHPGGPLAFKDDARGMRADNDSKVRPVHRRMQIGGGRRAALAVAAFAPELRDLIEPGPFLLDPVEIVVATDLVFAAGLDKGPGERTRLLLLRDPQRSVAAMQGVSAALVAFGASEIRQHLVP